VDPGWEMDDPTDSNSQSHYKDGAMALQPEQAKDGAVALQPLA
jgi:hypothetical protein